MESNNCHITTHQLQQRLTETIEHLFPSTTVGHTFCSSLREQRNLVHDKNIVHGRMANAQLSQESSLPISHCGIPTATATTSGVGGAWPNTPCTSIEQPVQQPCQLKRTVQVQMRRAPKTIQLHNIAQLLVHHQSTHDQVRVKLQTFGGVTHVLQVLEAVLVCQTLPGVHIIVDKCVVHVITWQQAMTSWFQPSSHPVCSF